MASQHRTDPQTRRLVVRVGVAAIAGFIAIATIMLARSVVAFVAGYTVALVITACLGFYMLRSTRGDGPRDWPSARSDVHDRRRA